MRAWILVLLLPVLAPTHESRAADPYPKGWSRRWELQLAGGPAGVLESEVAERDEATILFRTLTTLRVKASGQEIESVLTAEHRVSARDFLPLSYKLTATAGGTLQAVITAEFPAGGDPQVRTVSGPIDRTVAIPAGPGARILCTRSLYEPHADYPTPREDSYFLVVSGCPPAETSYGRDSSGIERPVGDPRCR